MKTTSASFETFLVEIFQSKQHDYLYCIKIINTTLWLPKIPKAVIAKQISKPGRYWITAKQYKNDKGYDSLYIHNAKPA
jgi:hypothetical protein